MIQNDIEAGRAGRNFPGSIALVGDAKCTLGQLIEALPQGETTRQRLRLWIDERRRAWYRAAPEPKVSDHGTPLAPRDVFCV